MSSNPRIPYQMSSERSPLEGIDGKPLIVHLVVNVEHWLFDQGMPRKYLTAPHGLEQIPDIPNFAWAEYGMRAGMPRLLECFERRGLPASVSLNAGVIEAYPSCAVAMRDAGWEFIGHGVHQKSIQGETDESDVRTKTLCLRLRGGARSASRRSRCYSRPWVKVHLPVYKRGWSHVLLRSLHRLSDSGWT